MNRRSSARNRAAVLIVACVVSFATLAQATEDPGVTPDLDMKIDIRSVDDLGRIIDGRKRLAWTVREKSTDAGPDRAGRTLDQYADQYVFTDEAEAKLQSLRQAAGEQASAGDQAGLDASLRQASELMSRDLKKLMALHFYYHALDLASRHEAALNVLIGKSPEAERAGTRARIDPMLNALPGFMEQSLSAAPFPDVLSSTVFLTSFNPLFSAYNEERQRLAAFASASDRQHGVEPLSLTRTEPCNGPVPTPSDDDVPRIDRSTVTLPVYPDDARRYSFEGQVVIRVTVAANGCPERVQIERTVGYGPLDESALEWAKGLRFHPASEHGKPVAGTAIIASEFRLKD